MATKLPSFLQTKDAAPSAEAPLPVAPVAIFRAPRPELVVEAPAVPAAIFKTRAPQLIAEAKPAARPKRKRTVPAPAASAAHGIPDPSPGFRVTPLPRLAQGGKWRTEAMRSYSFPVLLWFTRGQGRITVSGVTRGFGAHNAVFLPPHTMHGFEVVGQVFGNAVFFPRDSGLSLPERPSHMRFREASEQAELNLLIDNLQRELESGLPIADRAMSCHAGLLSVWLERQVLRQNGPQPAETAAARLSSAYAALVESDFAQGLSVAEFAERLGVTPTHLTRSCNAACGRSAHEILADRIFFEARRLLRETDTPVKEIASGLGFNSAAYFTRAFIKVAGTTPSQFRRRH